MKKCILCLITAFMLAACKQEGEVKVKLTTTDKNGVRPDNGSSIYFMPADSIHIRSNFPYWDADKTNLIQSLAANFERRKWELRDLYQNLKSAAGKAEIEKIKMQIVSVESQDSIDRQNFNAAVAEMKRAVDTVTVIANAFKKSGTKLTIDGAGTCTTTLPAGQYRILIESKSCLQKALPYQVKQYYLDSVTVVRGEVAAVNTQLTDCLEH